MKVRSLHLTLLPILLLFLEFSAIAQMSSAQKFAEKQFYGNRVRAGSVLLSGSFQRSNTPNSNIENFTGNFGLGIGVGLSENIVLNAGYNRDRSYEVFSDPFVGSATWYETNQSINAGFRFLPNAWGGFVQAYAGLDFLWLKQDRRRESLDDDPFVERTILGGQIPVGAIFWISNFMSVNLELLNFSLLGEQGDNVDWEGQYNFDLNVTNPRIGITFIISAKKPPSLSNE